MREAAGTVFVDIEQTFLPPGHMLVVPKGAGPIVANSPVIRALATVAFPPLVVKRPLSGVKREGWNFEEAVPWGPQALEATFNALYGRAWPKADRPSMEFSKNTVPNRAARRKQSRNKYGGVV